MVHHGTPIAMAPMLSGANSEKVTEPIIVKYLFYQLIIVLYNLPDVGLGSFEVGVIVALRHV